MANKILVIDDDLYLRDLYTEILQSEGFEVETEPNGEEGFKKLQNGGYALVLLDMVMPKMDGLAVLKALKANPPKVPNGPIVILTNLSHDPLIDEVAKEGVKAYLIKAELTPDQVVDYVKKLLKPTE